MGTANNIIMNRDTTGMGGEDAGKSSVEIRLERKQKLAAALRLFGKLGFDEGEGLLNGAAWSSLGRLLDPITQDACAFYEDHVLFDDFTGVVLDSSEGERIARALGEHKAAILQNHGLLTVGETVDEAAWWFISMERSCQAQLLAEAAGTPKLIKPECATETRGTVGSALAGWFSFQPLYDVIVAEQPELLD